MLKILDRFLDGISMYALLHYGLIAILAIAGIFGFFHILPYSPVAILISSIFLVLVCWISNIVFSHVFEVPAAAESYVITALILACIISPIQTVHGIVFLGWAGLLAMASKYILAIHGKHIFNPAAVSVVLTSFWLTQSASWWMGTAAMMPFVLVFGLLIVRKIQKEYMVFIFFLTALLTGAFFAVINGNNLFSSEQKIILDSSLLFFGFIMFTEPLTTPTTKKWQIVYGVLVGFIFYPQVHIGSLYSTPELALIVGNIFAYVVSSKQRFILQLKEKIQIGADAMEFLFSPNQKPIFTPGQYIELTLPHRHVDFRGNRRYFTIASSPTEDTMQFGIKFYPQAVPAGRQGSSFKKALSQIDSSSRLLAGSLAGDFTLPQDPSKKLVFIAGGIGITPFRSMIKFLIDIKQKRDIVVFYSNKTATEIMYQDVLTASQNQLGIKTVYTLTDTASIPDTWRARVGRIDAKMIQEVGDWNERLFYLSGPHAMVTAFEQTLKNMGVSKDHIKKDFFPGYV